MALKINHITPKSPKGDLTNTNGRFAVSKSPLGDLGVRTRKQKQLFSYV